ncbi:hypothetical protein CN223_29145 [Sinorhizobium meliloti]|nr:hypothetical protein CN223_29145 [Sinorhizobium meliloti]
MFIKVGRSRNIGNRGMGDQRHDDEAEGDGDDRLATDCGDWREQPVAEHGQSKRQWKSQDHAQRGRWRTEWTTRVGGIMAASGCGRSPAGRSSARRPVPSC